MTELFRYILVIWLGLLAVRVFYDLVIRQHALQGILSTGPGKPADPERVTLLVLTIGFALYYTLTTMSTPVADLPKIDGVPAMPDVSNEILLALFGAQSTYLIGKAMRLFKGI